MFAGGLERKFLSSESHSAASEEGRPLLKVRTRTRHNLEDWTGGLK